MIHIKIRETTLKKKYNNHIKKQNKKIKYIINLFFILKENLKSAKKYEFFVQKIWKFVSAIILKIWKSFFEIDKKKNKEKSREKIMT